MVGPVERLACEVRETHDRRRVVAQSTEVVASCGDFRREREVLEAVVQIRLGIEEIVLGHLLDLRVLRRRLGDLFRGVG